MLALRSPALRRAPAAVRLASARAAAGGTPPAPERPAWHLLAEHGGAALQPAKVNGRWQPPRLSRRKAAELRKRAERDGSYGAFSAEAGGWDPAWDPQRKFRVMRPPKNPRAKRRAERFEKVQEGLANQEKLMKEWREMKDARRPPDNALRWLYHYPRAETRQSVSQAAKPMW